jgi:integrase
MTEAEVDRLADAIDTRFRGLGVYGAMRYGELAGLRVDRLRLLERKIEIVETLEGNEPKWGSSGTVTIPSIVAEELAHHLTLHPAGPGGLVFTMPMGGPLSYHNFLRRFWRPAAEAAGLGRLDIERVNGRRREHWEGATPHDLRHSGVALAIKAGAHPKAIQELCRHSSFITTMSVYGYLFPGLHEDLAASLDDAIRQSRTGPGRDEAGTAVVPLHPAGTENVR